MIDFIINSKSVTSDGLVITGQASTNKRDKHNESITISPNAFKNALGPFLKKGGKMLAEHGFEPKYGKRIVGKVLNMEYWPKEYSIDSPNMLKMSLNAVALLTDKDIIQDVLSGQKDSFSLNWITKSWLVNQKTKQRIDTDIQINELTITRNPANTEAKFTIVKDDDLIKQYKLGEKVEIYDTIASIKSLYVDEKGKYYVDLDFDDEIVNIKSANKVPVSFLNKKTVSIPKFKTNIKKKMDNYIQI